MAIVLNERAYAEHAIANMTLGKKPSETLGRVARYYYSEGVPKRQIGEKLTEFLLSCEPDVNAARWQDTIDRIAGTADKFALLEIPGIPVTKGELQRIRELEGRQAQRLLFTMLCLAKYGDAVNETNNGWVNRKDREIFSLANITTTARRQSLMLNGLWTAGCIGFSRAVDNVNMRVEIIDRESPEDLFITDFRNLGNQYMRYCGEKYIRCASCGAVVKRASGRQKYCAACAEDVNRRRAAEAYRAKSCS